MEKLKIGDQAPAFSLLDQSENTVSLSDFKGKKVLIYFYPKADTPGCTKQACSLRDASSELIDKSIVTLGISPDMPAKQKKFADKYKLDFPLLCDTDNTVAKQYSAWGEKSMYGKTYEGIIRSSFLIDEDGRIVQASYKVKPLDTLPKALKAIS